MSIQPGSLPRPSPTASRVDEISPIPHPLGIDTSTGSDTPGFDNPPGIDGDINVAGIMFQSAAGDQNPYQRQLPKVTKDQMDTSDNPGDNSLQDWWMRTQTDWSGGAGQEFMEPIRLAGVDRRFWSSAGVDPFTHPGQVLALPTATPVGAFSPGASIIQFSGGYAVADGTQVILYSIDPSLPPVAPVETARYSLRGPAGSMTVGSGCILVASPGAVEVFPLDGSASSATYTSASTSTPIVSYMKNRALVMIDDKLWEIPGNPLVDHDLSVDKPKVDMHDSTWSWVDAANSPKAMLVAGNTADAGMVFALTLDPQSGNLPDLGAPVMVAELPPHEKITGITTYLGAYVTLATSGGIRVGELADGGGLTYGPHLGSPLMQGGSFTAWDRFLQYAVADAGDGQGGLVRIDLSEYGQDRRPAWATFLRIPTTAAVVGHIILGPTSAVLLDATGRLWLSTPGNPRDTGWLQTSKVRYGTLEPKTFALVRVMAVPPPDGVLEAYTVIGDKVASRMGQLDARTGPEKTLSTGNSVVLAEMALEFRWRADANDATKAPALEAWSMKSLPALTSEGERILLPLLCFDYERASTGVNVGRDGWAKDRWEALVARATVGGNLQITEINSGMSYVATVEDCLFTQVSPPIRASGFGGIITLKLRKVVRT